MPSVLYSCVIDNKPVYYYQGIVFVHTLIELANVDPQSIVSHFIEGTPEAAVGPFKRLGVHTVMTPPFNSQRPTSHRFVQLETDLLHRCDYAVLCDTDLALAGSVSDWIAGDRLRAKPVDYPRPPLALWPAIFAALEVHAELPAFNATHEDEPTYANNFNGGLYIIPQRIMGELREVWPRRYNQLLANAGLLERLGDSAVHVFQIALGIAMAELGHRGDPLPLEMNFPTHVPMPDHNRLLHEPLVIHYHKELDFSGRLLRTGNALVDQAIDRINTLVEGSPVIRRVASNPALKRAILDKTLKRAASRWRKRLTAPA